MHFRFNDIRSVWSRLEAEKLSYFRKLWKKKGKKLRKENETRRGTSSERGWSFSCRCLSAQRRNDRIRRCGKVVLSAALVCPFDDPRFFDSRGGRIKKSGRDRGGCRLTFSFPSNSKNVRGTIYGVIISGVFFFQLSINSRRKSLATRSFVLEQAANAFNLILRSGRSWVWSIITSLFLKEHCRWRGSFARNWSYLVFSASLK